MKTVTQDTLVRIAVRMSDLQGHVLDETPLDGVWYLHGRGDIFPAFEEKFAGKPVGTSLSFTLEPEQAFGEFDETLVILRDAKDLADPADVRVGLRFESVAGAKPSSRPYRITDLADGKALLDANHPLAGWTLRFDVKILEIVDVPEGEIGDAVPVPDFLSVPGSV